MPRHAGGEHHSAHKARISESIAMTQARIVIVDDEVIVGADIERIVASLGYMVVGTAVTGEQALELVLREKPDIVLMDIKLKGDMDGITCADKIHEHLDIPVIYITAFADELILQRAAISDPYGYVLKPFEPRDIYIAIEIALFKRNAEIQEHAAQEEFYRLYAALDQVGAFIFMADADGTITYANKFIETIAGYLPGEVIGKNIRQSTLGVCSTDEHQRIIHTIFSGKTWSGRFSNKTRQGSLLQIESTITPIHDASGNIQCFIGINRDITKEFSLEVQIRQAQKMDAIGTLAGGIAHDFNNILSAIMGYTELSLMTLEPGAELRRNLDQVLKAADRARGLVRQIVTFCRQSDQERMPLHVTPLVKETIKMLHATVPSTIDINLHIHAQRDLIRADATQIHQVLMNLCTNAVYAMRGVQGKLTLSLDNAEFTAIEEAALQGMPPGAYLVITVADSGNGISSDIMDRVFEPFFTTKPQGEGTGLGLSVAHGIVKSHEGYISVACTEGQGAVFTVYLPLLSSGQEATPAQAVLASGGSGRILFIDDDKTLAHMGQQMLEVLGYTVTAMTDSIKALSFFKEQPDAFDLVITDYTMPGMTGTELVECLRQLRPDIPVVLYTGYNEMITSEKADALGIQEFLYKPLSMNMLAEAVKRAVIKL